MIKNPDKDLVNMKSCPLLVGMWSCAITMEITVELPQKARPDSPHDLPVPPLGVHPKDSISYCRDDFSSLFIGAPFQSQMVINWCLNSENVVHLPKEYYSCVINEMMKIGVKVGNNHSEWVTWELKRQMSHAVYNLLMIAGIYVFCWESP